MPVAILLGIVFRHWWGENGSTEARLEAAVIMPHGDAALDSSSFFPAHDYRYTNERRAATEVHEGSIRTGRWLGESMNPELLVLITPHGIELSADIAVYLGTWAGGSTTIGRDDYIPHVSPRHPYRVTLPLIRLDRNISEQIIEEAMHHGYNVSGVSVPSDHASDDMIPLQWGEIIPLLLIPSSHRNYNRRHVIVSFPRRRYTEASDMVPAMLEWGRSLRQYMDRLTDRIGLVVSGDLSHTHRSDGPYGYSNTSSTYDTAIQIWVDAPCSEQGQQALLRTARGIQSQALSCGFLGFILLHGILCGDFSAGHNDKDDRNDRQSRMTTERSDIPQNSHETSWLRRSSSHPVKVADEMNGGEWQSWVIVNRNVTYFGMMAAQFQRRMSVVESKTQFLNARRKIREKGCAKSNRV